MSAAATTALSVAGVLLVATALRDVFDTLFHESGKGLLSRLVTRGVWNVVRRLRGRRSLSLSGPISLIAVVLTWATLLVVGWALLFLPHMPKDFAFTSSASSGRLVDSLYLSLVTLTTVGFGDITPATGWLRLLTPTEALVGFGLLTASVSWLLSLYPLLSRRRALAYEIHLLGEAQSELGTALHTLDPAAVERVYSELTSTLVSVERDLVTFPVAYYFAEADDRFALPAAMPALLRLADAGRAAEGSAAVRLRASMLRNAIDDFAKTTADRFHGSKADNTEELLGDYARDHLVACSPASTTS